ncbi:hypothetical protein M9H77_04416 [Catharanthus roseus]|uniref:Uncharacterized protein n=1 Tax=Catharanthus roseus TaxID=4058 RepID=A0ACC0CEK2_CATRO|nr:hypothetical protein M9H77_04416 [Catharanthus roseus]
MTNQVKSFIPKMRENMSNDVQPRQNDDKVRSSRIDREEAYPVKESGNMQQKLNPESSSSEAHLRQDSGKLKNKLDGVDQRHSADAGDCSPNSSGEAVPECGSHATLSKQSHIVPKTEVRDLMQTEVPKNRNHVSVSNEKLIHENGYHAPKSNQVFLMPKQESDLLEQRQSSDAGIRTPASGEKKIHESAKGSSEFNQVSIVPKPDKDGSDHGQIRGAGIHASATYGGTVSNVLTEASSNSVDFQSTNTQVYVSTSNQEKLSYTMRPEKTVYKLQPRRNPDSGVRASPSEQAIVSPRIQEKALDDGYNWRKYGQKLVKGNVFVRSYYKCTYASCTSKKQVERSYDGRLTDIKYIGKHEHPKPQNSPPISAFVPPQEVPKLDMAVTAASEANGKPSFPHQDISKAIVPSGAPKQSALTSNEGEISRSQNSHDNDDDSPNTKKQKRETANVDDNLVKKTYCESRYVVQTMSEVDVINDCYRWRKYGQKLVKGNPNPRSYYRCSNSGCPVKKHVERSSHDPKIVITTYEGKHDHEMPASSSSSQTAVGSHIDRKTVSTESTSENKPVGMEMVVHIGAN